MDDVLAFSPDIEMYLHLHILFDRLREANLEEIKGTFLKPNVQYLGCLISGQGMESVPEKLESVWDMPFPKTAREVK